MTASAEWTWETRRGAAAALHEPTPPTAVGRTVHEMLVDAPAIVLGSSQAETDIDPGRAAARGVSVVRRRSGGGAVLLVPGDHVWLDVWLPAADPLWNDDVGRAADWLAAVWVSASGSRGFADSRAHRGPLVVGDWSSQVCFAGLGPGEVTSAGRKLVGVSQRRTRDWARFQCLIHRRWDAAATFGLLTAPDAVVAAGTWTAGVAEVGAAPVVPAFAAALARLT